MTRERRCLSAHTSKGIQLTPRTNWDGLRNGELLDAAEKAGYQLLVTTDQNLKHQQNLRGRKLAILVLLSTSWLRLKARAIAQTIQTMHAGEYSEFDPE